MFLFLTARDILDSNEIRVGNTILKLINSQLFPYNNLCHSEVTDTACSLCKREEVLYILGFHVTS